MENQENSNGIRGKFDRSVEELVEFADTCRDKVYCQPGEFRALLDAGANFRNFNVGQIGSPGYLQEVVYEGREFVHVSEDVISVNDLL